MTTMMTITHPVSRTALFTAAARARESQRADHLFVDPFAEALAGAEGFALMDRIEASPWSADSTEPTENAYIAIRTRVIDDFVVGALSAEDIRQVVLVAAGLDSRAFRLPLRTTTQWFELDRAEVLQAKQAVFNRLASLPRCERHALGVNLANPWADALVRDGFDRSAPSVWVVEGLLTYLYEHQVHDVLRQTAMLAAPGSRLVADLPGRGVLESPWTRSYIVAMDRESAPWRFGSDEPEALFGAHGWQAAVRRPGEEGAHWGRWPHPVPPRTETHLPQNYFVTAVRR